MAIPQAFLAALAFMYDLFGGYSLFQNINSQRGAVSAVNFTSAGSCATLMQGQDCSGNDISHQGGSSVEQCCEMCSRMQGCNAFTFRYGQCYFKTSCSQSTACSDCVAGITANAPSGSSCASQMHGQDCQGENLENQAASSFEQCCGLCKTISGCNSFTYRWGKCWFKSGCVESSSCSDCVAGTLPTPPPTPPGPPFVKLAGVQSNSNLTSLLSPIKLERQPVTSAVNDADEIVVTIDASLQYQAILGFGGAFTEAAANNFASLSAADQEVVLNAYFASPENGGHGYTVGRVHMNSCDFSVASYSFDDQAGDSSLAHFDTNVTHDQRTMLPFIRRALAKAPDAIKIFVSPWSPPAWMKTNGKMTNGGKLKTEYQAAWAMYFSKFFTAYKANGVDLWGLTVQNEPGASQSWESCVYSADETRDFVNTHLGPVMRRDHPKSKIMVLDHNRDMVPEWAKTIFADANTAKYVDGLALHWYDSRNAQMYANVEAAHDEYLSKLPGRFILATEACNCPGVQLRNWDRAWSIASDILGDLNAWAVGWTDWNLMVDHRGGPNHLGNFCDANLIADPDNVLKAGTVIKQVSYYLMGHFSRYLRPGMVRIKTTSNGDLSLTSFRDIVTKKTAVVVMNGLGSAQSFSLHDKESGRSGTGLSIPAHSIQTYTYTAVGDASVVV